MIQLKLYITLQTILPYACIVVQNCHMNAIMQCVFNTPSWSCVFRELFRIHPGDCDKKCCLISISKPILTNVAVVILHDSFVTCVVLTVLLNNVNIGHLCCIGAIKRMLSDYKYSQGRSSSTSVYPMLSCLPSKIIPICIIAIG